MSNTITSTVTLGGIPYTVTTTLVPVAAPAPSGSQAGRISDLLALGLNGFAMLDSNQDPWGAWPADYSPPTVIAAIQWLQNGSNIPIPVRTYTYADRADLVGQWCRQIYATTQSPITLAIGEGGTIADVPSALALAADPTTGIRWLEGINEPSTTGVPSTTTLAIQAALRAGLPPGIQLMTPSFACLLPFPEKTVQGYLTAAEIAAIDAQSDLANIHYYPPRNGTIDDGSNRGGSLADFVTGFQSLFPGKPQLVTEYHPTLYNQDGQSANDTLAAYLLPIDLLEANRLGIMNSATPMWWFSLFDYGADMRSGLFPTNTTNPRLPAYVLRALHTLMADRGPNRLTFIPGSLGDTVSGLPPPINTTNPRTGGQTALYQASDGRFFRLIWNSQAMSGGPSVPVTVTFANAVKAVTEYNLTAYPSNATTPVWTGTNVSQISFPLDASVHLLVIDP